MTPDERDEYGEEARDTIEGLRRLAESIETPSDLLPRVLARGAPLLPHRERLGTRWGNIVPSWLLRPIVWAPVLAVACFIAGMFVPPRQFGTPIPSAAPNRVDAVLEQRSATPVKPGAREEAKAKRPSPATRPQFGQEVGRRPEEGAGQTSTALSALQDELLQQQAAPREAPAPPSEQRFKATTDRRVSQARPVPQAQITFALPKALHEQLAREAQRRNETLDQVLREAVEAYMHRRQTQGDD